MITVRTLSPDTQDEIELRRRVDGQTAYDQGFFLCRCLRSFFFLLCLFIFRLRCFFGQGTESLLWLRNDLVQRVFNNAGGARLFEFRNKFAYDGLINNRLDIEPVFVR